MSEQNRFTATKLDTGKPPLDLLPWEAVTGTAQVLDFGRQKYAPWNWRKGFLWSRLAAAALRHIFAWLSGEDVDPESGLSHIDHATCCLMFLSAHIKSGLGKDDRACKLLTEGRADVETKEEERIPAAHVPNIPESRWFVVLKADSASARMQCVQNDPVKRRREGPFINRELAEKSLSTACNGLWNNGLYTIEQQEI